MIDFFLQYLNQLAVGCTIVTFILMLYKNHRAGVTASLETLLVPAFSAAALPTGVALLMCAFDTNLLQKLTDYNVHIAVSGLALLYVSVSALRN